MALSSSTLVVANRFFEVLDAAKGSLGIANVWFGDQELLPRTPAVCVEPGTKRRDLHAVQNMTTNIIDTHFLIYHSQVSTSQQITRRDTIAFAEGIEDFLHQNHLILRDADGEQLTVHGHCVDMDPGYIRRDEKTLYNAVQMIWSSITKTRLQA